VLAIAVHEAFLQDEPGSVARSRLSDQDRARAIAAANERLFGDG